jgi:cytochrome P450
VNRPLTQDEMKHRAPTCTGEPLTVVRPPPLTQIRSSANGAAHEISAIMAARGEGCEMDLRSKLLGPDMVTDPYPTYARLRQETPVLRMSLRDGMSCWVIFRHEDARAALADQRLSRDPRAAGPAWREVDRGRPLEDGSGLGVHLLTREPPDHTRLRQLVSHAFTARQTEALRMRVEEIAHSLIDEFASQGAAEIIAELAYPLPINVVCEVLGIPVSDHGYFRQWTSNAVSARPRQGRGCPADIPGPDEYLRTLIAAKRRDPGDDLVSHLVAANDDGRLTETELASMIFLLLIAGHENTAGLIGNGVVALLSSPAQLALLRERPGLTGAAVEEILRYDGPTELAAWRFTTEPVTIGGVVIPAGEPVLIALAAAHRDPERFSEPDRFDISRTDNAHLGFGYGLHYCLGASLARMEATVALGALFQRLPDLTLATPAPRLRRQPSSVVRGLHELPVTFTPVSSPRRSR